MPRLLVFIMLFLFSGKLKAQEKILIAEGNTPDIYLNHIVTPKENYYSVGRMYNYSPKAIAVYNNLEFEKGLTLGQTIKVPLKESNFLQGVEPSKDEAVIPVYHIVQAKEGLYRVSLNFNKVPLDYLKKWNSLNGDAVTSGIKLVIGYLKVLKDQSPLALQGVKILPANEVIKKPEEKMKKDVKPAEVVTKVETPKKETLPKINPVIKDKPAEDKVAVPVRGSINFNGGKFKKLYNDQSDNKTVVNENGVAAIFKTTSGWQDGKYYCFHNTALPGTIIKITNNANSKTIYAKVLDAIPDMKQNSGLLLRVSNSAAEELGAGENKFDCSITYSK